MTDSISFAHADTAEKGTRGELNHVQGGYFSVHAWDLTDLARTQTHSNPYGHVSYVTEGELFVFDADDNRTSVKAGDSVHIPAGADYSMETARAKTVEIRFK